MLGLKNHCFPVAQMVKNPPVMQETWVWSLGAEDPLEKGMATHSGILAWRIPWTEEPDRLWGHSLWALRVRPDWETNSFTFAKPLGIFPTESFCKYWYMIHVSVLNTWWKTIYTKKFTFKIRKNRMKIHKIIKMANGKALWVLYPLKFQMSLKFVISKKMRTFW